MTSIKIETKSGESMEIPLYDRVVVITGNVPSGKTKMLHWLSACKYVPQEIKEASVNLDDILVVSDRSIMECVVKSQVTGKYIFIDHYSFMENNKEIYHFIMESNNVFVIMGHRNAGGLAIQDAILKLEHDGMHYTCQQMYQHGLFKPLEEV